MKKILYLVLVIILLISFGSALYLINIGYFIDYDDINNFEEMFERQDKDISTYTADGITCTSKVIVNNYKYKVVGAKSFRSFSIAIYNKKAKKLDIYEKNLLLKSNDIFFKKSTVDLSNIK